MSLPQFHIKSPTKTLGGLVPGDVFELHNTTRGDALYLVVDTGALTSGNSPVDYRRYVKINGGAYRMFHSHVDTRVIRLGRLEEMG